MRCAAALWRRELGEQGEGAVISSQPKSRPGHAPARVPLEIQSAAPRREKGEKFEAILFPTPRPLWVPGMDRKSAMLSLPACLYEMNGAAEPTAHRRTTLQRPADKAKQRDLRAAHAGIALQALPKDGGHKLQVHHQPLARWAAALGYRWPQSACRLLRRKGRAVVTITRKKQRVEAGWNLTEFARAGYHQSCFQPGSAAELATLPKHAHLFTAAPTGVQSSGGKSTEVEFTDVKFRKFAAIAHDPLSVLRGTALEVYDYLVEHDLYVYNKATKRWKAGKVQKTQEEIGAALGRHRGAVARALRRLSVSWTDRSGTKHPGLGLIMYVGKPGAWYLRKTGEPLDKQPTLEQKRAGLVEWRQDEPNEYIGVCDWVETEKERYERAMEPVWASSANWAELMDKIFRRTLLQWSEPEKDEEAFHAECRRLMAEAGIPEWQIAVVFPHSHAPP